MHGESLAFFLLLAQTLGGHKLKEKLRKLDIIISCKPGVHAMHVIGAL